MSLRETKMVICLKTKSEQLDWLKIPNPEKTLLVKKNREKLQRKTTETKLWQSLPEAESLTNNGNIVYKGDQPLNGLLFKRVRKFSLKQVLAVVAVVALLTSMVIIFYFQHTLPAYTSEPLYLDALPSTATYTIETDGVGNYRAVRYDGRVLWESTNASYTINSAINALTSGGKIFIKAGEYGLAAPILIQRNGTSLIGEGGFSDLFFTSDTYYEGYEGKAATLLYDASENGIDVIKVGFKDRMSGACNLTFGVTIKDIMVSGYLTPPRNDGIQKLGSGIICQNVENLRLENLAVFRKTYGIKIQTVGPWHWDNVNDVTILRNIALAYNVFGLYNDGWLANLRAENIFGYINEEGLIKLNQLNYDAHISHVWSNADGWNSTNIRNCSIHLGIKANVYLTDVTIQNTCGESVTAYTGIFLEFNTGTVNGKAFLDRIAIQGVNGDAFRIDGADDCDVYLDNIYVGQAGSEALAGGNGTVAGSIVKNYNSKIRVYVNGGFVNCSQIKERYFVNVTSVSNLSNYITQRSGEAIFSNNNTVTFDHGLVCTPTIVWCSFNNTGWGDWKWSATSTQLTITTSNNINAACYWTAEYKP